MSTMSLRIPDSYHKRLRLLAKKENVSINQLITVALGEKLSALDTEDMIEKRSAKASKGKFKQALKKIPDVKPVPGDDL